MHDGSCRFSCQRKSTEKIQEIEQLNCIYYGINKDKVQTHNCGGQGRRPLFPDYTEQGNPPDEYGLQNKFLTYGLNFIKYPSGKFHNREYVIKRYEFLRFYVYFCLSVKKVLIFIAKLS